MSQEPRPAHGTRARARPLAVALVSGGLDSAVLLWWLAVCSRPRYDVLALCLDYGQHHAGLEVRAAQRVTSWAPFPVRLEVPTLPALAGIFGPTTALTGPTVPLPHGPETEASARQMFVPNRNAVLLSLAFARAQALGARAVAIGTYDCYYPDCGGPFLRSFARMQRQALAGMTAGGHPIKLLAPFVTWNKAEVVALGHELGVPFERTRTCQDHYPEACGRCASCLARLASFRENGLTDPLRYRRMPSAAELDAAS